MDDKDVSSVVAVIILLIVGFTVASLLMIFTGVLGGQVYQQSEANIQDIAYTSSAVTSESFTAYGPDNKSWSWTALDHRPIVNITNHKYTIYNATGNTNTSDFVVNLTDGTLALKFGAIKNNGTTYYIDYEYKDYTIRTSILGSVISNFYAQNQIANFIPIIALALIITLILIVIISGFSSSIGPLFGRNQGGSGLL